MWGYLVPFPSITSRRCNRLFCLASFGGRGNGDGNDAWVRVRAGALQCSDTKRDVPIEAMMDVPGLVLYSIEIIDKEILLLFMQVRFINLHRSFPHGTFASYDLSVFSALLHIKMRIAVDARRRFTFRSSSLHVVL